MKNSKKSKVAKNEISENLNNEISEKKANVKKLVISENLVNQLNAINLKKSIANVSNKSIYNFALFFASALTDKLIQKKFRSFFRRFKITFVCTFLNAIKEKTVKDTDYLLQFIFIKTFFVCNSLQINDFCNAKKENEATNIYIIYLNILSEYQIKNNIKLSDIKANLDNTNFAKIKEQINYLSKLIIK